MSRIGNMTHTARGVRLIALVTILAAYWITPARATLSCKECVWNWNGSAYVSACQLTFEGGWGTCDPDFDPEWGGYICWVDDPCEG